MEGELTYEIKTRIESELEVKAYLQNYSSDVPIQKAIGGFREYEDC